MAQRQPPPSTSAAGPLVLFLLGLVCFTWPLLSVLDHPDPYIAYGLIFGVWGIFVGLLAYLARRIASTTERKQDHARDPV